MTRDLLKARRRGGARNARCCWPRWSAPGSWRSGLAGGNVAVALLCNTTAHRRRSLMVLILVFGSLSGAHFNPVVSAAFCDRAASFHGWTPRSTSPRRLPGGRTGRLGGAPDVRSGAAAAFAHCAQRRRPMVLRRGCDLRPAADHLRLSCVRRRHRCLCGRAVHHRRILVHRLHIIRQSGGDGGAFAVRHVRRALRRSMLRHSSRPRSSAPQ